MQHNVTNLRKLIKRLAQPQATPRTREQTQVQQLRPRPTRLQRPQHQQPQMQPSNRMTLSIPEEETLIFTQ
jgi:hypothetical protein